jgi:phosphoribosylglycinamide formyltransferase-1
MPLQGHFKGVITLGILGSGSGSNFQAILDAIDAGSLQARVALVLSDNPQGSILERAQKRGIPTGIIDCGGFRTKFPEDAQMTTATALQEAGVELVCLAGFMRLVKKPLLEAFPARILNIHPSLLPAFPGVAAWKQALAAKAEKTGCTVHLVDEGTDTGPTLGQAEVPIHLTDDDATLHKRIQEEEHRLYPEVIARYAEALPPLPSSRG